jgi:hypothetical protein
MYEQNGLRVRSRDAEEIPARKMRTLDRGIRKVITMALTSKCSTGKQVCRMEDTMESRVEDEPKVPDSGSCLRR